MITNPVETNPGGTLGELITDLTPLLDILFILIVFFLLTAGAVFHSMELELPKSVSEDIPIVDNAKNIVLEIQNNYYRINGKQIPSFELLKTALQKAMNSQPEHELVIASDKNASVDQLMQILTYLQAKQIDTANILMLKEPTTP